MFTSINDSKAVKSISKKGNIKIKIWYVSENGDLYHGDYIRDLSCGYKRYVKGNEKYINYDVANVGETHVSIGEFTTDICDDMFLNEIYSVFQGERWSPEGEARALINSLDAIHTSISIGDIIQVNEIFYVVDRSGFEILN